MHNLFGTQNFRLRQWGFSLPGLRTLDPPLSPPSTPFFPKITLLVILCPKQIMQYKLKSIFWNNVSNCIQPYSGAISRTLKMDRPIKNWDLKFCYIENLQNPTTFRKLWRKILSHWQPCLICGLQKSINLKNNVTSSLKGRGGGNQSNF